MSFNTDANANESSVSKHQRSWKFKYFVVSYLSVSLVVSLYYAVVLFRALYDPSSAVLGPGRVDTKTDWQFWARTTERFTYSLVFKVFIVELLQSADWKWGWAAKDVCWHISNLLDMKAAYGGLREDFTWKEVVRWSSGFLTALLGIAASVCSYKGRNSFGTYFGRSRNTPEENFKAEDTVKEHKER